MSVEANVRAIFALLDEMAREVDEIVSEKFEPSGDFTVRGYGDLYELSVKHIAGFLFQRAGLWDAVVKAAQSSDPNAALIEVARSAEPTNAINSENAGVLLVALVLLFTNLEAIATFNMTMAELLREVRKGDDTSLFRAVLLDPSVLHSRPVADRVSKAALLDDRSFFDALAKAITKTKPARPREHLDKVRILMSVLEDAGELQGMTDAELTEWSVDKLGIYPSSGDALSAIRDQRRKRQKLRQGPKG